MTDLLDDDRYSYMDPASARMFDLAMDRVNEVRAAALDADRDAFGDHYDEYERDA